MNISRPTLDKQLNAAIANGYIEKYKNGYRLTDDSIFIKGRMTDDMIYDIVMPDRCLWFAMQNKN